MNQFNNFLIASLRYKWPFQKNSACFFDKSNELLKIR